jgi:hypothetical protein
VEGILRQHRKMSGECYYKNHHDIAQNQETDIKSLLSDKYPNSPQLIDSWNEYTAAKKMLNSMLKGA